MPASCESHGRNPDRSCAREFVIWGHPQHHFRMEFNDTKWFGLPASCRPLAAAFKAAGGSISGCLPG
jgi:hypothetical protein